MLPLKFSEQPVLVCKDHTVSGEFFELRKAKDLDLLATFPQPNLERLPDYYKSESYISHTDSKRGFFDKIYQQVKNLMLSRKLNWIAQEKTGKVKILDVGAGTGNFLLAAKKRGWKVFGAEPNSGARALASKKGVELEEETREFSSGSFDVITMWHVLEHVPNLEEQIEELYRLLKPDGLLVIAVPNFKSDDAQKYKEHWAAYDVPRHLYHFSPSAIEKIFNSSGFLLTSQKGLFFDSFYVSLLSEKYASGTSNVLKAVWKGAISNFKAKSSGNYSSVAYFFRKNN
ncbi:class I SAM-dependent methyltransferase [Salinimicrobium sp. MT39]|uniref:Class I SAM-dependent methyltransferase n=1 Tax=Salinimicrobium profundisediminis TaxID=2994553 RepID=A0A9X3CYD2_9FLAO|nr:class I SAM-dependent methyltransferase [Salinimicrobium profundisediminis]MCX2838878.1 class I SAM-dependent methyltransferase [Salinimicrobium profundisediminis]